MQAPMPTALHRTLRARWHIIWNQHLYTIVELRNYYTDHHYACTVGQTRCPEGQALPLIPEKDLHPPSHILWVEGTLQSNSIQFGAAWRLRDTAGQLTTGVETYRIVAQCSQACKERVRGCENGVTG